MSSPCKWPENRWVTQVISLYKIYIVEVELWNSYGNHLRPILPTRSPRWLVTGKRVWFLGILPEDFPDTQ